MRPPRPKRTMERPGCTVGSVRQSVRYEMASGDKNFFGLNGHYWRMSYRGRFLYDLFLTPIMSAAVAACVWWAYRPANITGYWIVGVLVLIGIASAAFNFIRWQAESRSASPDAAFDRGGP